MQGGSSLTVCPITLCLACSLPAPWTFLLFCDRVGLCLIRVFATLSPWNAVHSETGNLAVSEWAVSPTPFHSVSARMISLGEDLPWPSRLKQPPALQFTHLCCICHYLACCFFGFSLHVCCSLSLVSVRSGERKLCVGRGFTRCVHCHVLST